MRVERYLLGEERDVVMVRQHGIVLTRPAVQFVLVLLLSLIPLSGPLGTAAQYLLLLALADAVIRFARWRVQRFVITDQRVLLISGLVTRRVSMLPLRKVTDMSYQRTLFGRLLGYGEFIMESAGESQALHRVKYLPSPDQLYVDISALLFTPRTTAPADALEY